MNRLVIENKILSLIELHQGLKGQDLILKLMEHDLDTDKNQFFDIIFDMIERGEIIEIEYVFNHISKSFLVPRGTVVNVMRKR